MLIEVNGAKYLLQKGNLQHKNILSKNGIEVKLLEGKTANEESFKEMNGKSPDIIHLATHGFFIETQKQANNNKFFGMTTIYSPKNHI